MHKQRANSGSGGGGPNRPAAQTTDFDDWETDPDYIHDMDEMDQRWGAKRTVGSIDMNDLIDQVNREHKLMREKFHHPSQRLATLIDGAEARTAREPVQGYEERMSKHSSTQEISRKVYTSSGDGHESGLRPLSERRTFSETTSNYSPSSSKPKVATKPDYITQHSRPAATAAPLQTSTFTTAKTTLTQPKRFETSERTIKTEPDNSSRYKQSSISSTKRIFEGEKSSASSSRDKIDSMPPAFKSIQDKIEAFKKEFDDIESKVTRKSDISKVIKKSSNYDSSKHASSSNDLSYVTRDKNQTIPMRVATSSDKLSHQPPNNGRSSSATPTKSYDSMPRADIKGLSQRFETLCRESDDDFKRRTDAKRREFFDQIKDQVRETRKNFDSFEPMDSESDFGRPKVYTKSETTKEEIVSKVVKENDKIVENMTKRNMERTSSCHGSSDEEAVEPSSIKYISQQMSKSPTENLRAKSPIDEIKQKVPAVDPDVKGAGLMARTLYDYRASEDDELTFDVDDLITNIEILSLNWYKGVINKAGRKYTGLFPANHVKLLNDSDEY